MKISADVETGLALPGGGKAIGEAVPFHDLAYEQQADTLAPFLGGEEGRKQALRRHLAQQVAAVSVGNSFLCDLWLDTVNSLR